MLKLSIDLEACVMIASMAAGQTAEDHQRVYDAITVLDRKGHERGHPIAMVFLVSSDNPAPDADWRRRFAEQRKTLSSPQVFVSVVTRSAVMRGVLTAMNWMVPQPPHMKSLTHATFEECAVWVERVQGTSRIALQRLREDVEPSPQRRARAI